MTLSFSVSTLADPDIMVTTIPKRAMLNHTFTLTCSSSSIHDPEFKWYNGSFLLSKTDAGITIVAHGTSSTLTITHYMTSTSVLLCVSGDGLGRSNNVSTVVTLSNKLYLTREIGEQRVEERKGDQLQVECPIAGGIGDLMVRWYFGNTLLVNSTQYVINSRFLTFQSLNRTMDGQYRCVGKDSGLQVVSASFKLLITGISKYLQCNTLMGQQGHSTASASVATSASTEYCIAENIGGIKIVISCARPHPWQSMGRVVKSLHTSHANRIYIMQCIIAYLNYMYARIPGRLYDSYAGIYQTLSLVCGGWGLAHETRQFGKKTIVSQISVRQNECNLSVASAESPKL